MLRFNDMSKFEQAVVLDNIKSCIATASNHYGFVYGGFVRDVIVPQIMNPDCNVKFKDVDLWFETEESADRFIEAMGESFLQMKGIDVQVDEYPGAFRRKQYYLIGHNTVLAWIDIIISKYLPVDDFDVNTVLFWIENNEYRTDNSTLTRNLIKQIHEKRAIMMESYYKKYNMTQSRYLLQHFKSRVENMKKNGWHIVYPDDIWNSKPHLESENVSLKKQLVESKDILMKKIDTLEILNKELQNGNKSLSEKIQSFECLNKELQDRNGSLLEKIQSLECLNRVMQNGDRSLLEKIQALESMSKTFIDEKESLIEKIDSLESENFELKANLQEAISHALIKDKHLRNSDSENASLKMHFSEENNLLACKIQELEFAIDSMKKQFKDQKDLLTQKIETLEAENTLLIGHVVDFDNAILRAQVLEDENTGLKDQLKHFDSVVKEKMYHDIRKFIYDQLSLHKETEIIELKHLDFIPGSLLSITTTKDKYLGYYAKLIVQNALYRMKCNGHVSVSIKYLLSIIR